MHVVVHTFNNKFISHTFGYKDSQIALNLWTIEPLNYRHKTVKCYLKISLNCQKLPPTDSLDFLPWCRPLWSWPRDFGQIYITETLNNQNIKQSTHMLLKTR